MKNEIISDIQVKLKIRQLWFTLHSLQFNQDEIIFKQVLNELFELEQKLNDRIHYSEFPNQNN